MITSDFDSIELFCDAVVVVVSGVLAPVFFGENYIHNNKKGKNKFFLRLYSQLYINTRYASKITCNLLQM